MEPIDGFWLPRPLREQLLAPGTAYDSLSFVRGRPCAPGDEGAITARWPRLGPEQWPALLAGLRAGRERAPRGAAYWDRLQAAIQSVGRRLADPDDVLYRQAMDTLPGYTGYSAPMIRLALAGMDLVALDHLPAAFRTGPSARAAGEWEPLAGLPGRVRCYPDAGGRSRTIGSLLAGLPGRRRDGALFGPPVRPELVVGYGAGNVPGTALLIALLAEAATLDGGGAPPAVVVKNSRREPIFTPLVLAGLEAADPELVAGVAVLVWDYDDEAIQRLLLSQADLVIAAAGDDTIDRIRQALARSANGRPARFHAHGHKVSFAAIGAEVLARDLADPASGEPVIDVVTLLAALDSAFWDQNGCLSARVHFVEAAGAGQYTAADYAGRLAGQLRLLARFLPRGAWPRQMIADRFDRYKLMETGGRVQVMSDYDDDFLVAVDERPVDAAVFQSTVNDCQGRVVVVRPVASLHDIPERYLRLLPAANLQSLSVATGRPGEGLTDGLLRFADACGKRGVTAIRTVGRGAFPQLAHSWDGLIPLDLVRQPVGRFTTVEFDAPYDEMMGTYALFMSRSEEL